jgi:hypothetical protein
MERNHYTVDDHPALQESDDLNPNKNPDHRIDGIIFDSYAPKMEKTASSYYWDYSMNPLTEIDLDEYSFQDQKHWRGIEEKYMVKGIATKVREGMCLQENMFTSFRRNRLVSRNTIVQLTSICFIFFIIQYM